MPSWPGRTSSPRLSWPVRLSWPLSFWPPSSWRGPSWPGPTSSPGPTSWPPPSWPGPTSWPPLLGRGRLLRTARRLPIRLLVLVRLFVLVLRLFVLVRFLVELVLRLLVLRFLVLLPLLVLGLLVLGLLVLLRQPHLVTECARAALESVGEGTHTAIGDGRNRLPPRLQDIALELLLKLGDLRELTQTTHGLSRQLARLQPEPSARQIRGHRQRELALLRPAQHVSARNSRRQSHLGLVVHESITFHRRFRTVRIAAGMRGTSPPGRVNCRLSKGAAREGNSVTLASGDPGDCHAQQAHRTGAADFLVSPTLSSLYPNETAASGGTPAPPPPVTHNSGAVTHCHRRRALSPARDEDREPTGLRAPNYAGTGCRMGAPAWWRLARACR